MTTTADLHARANAEYARITNDSRLTAQAKRNDLIRVWAQLDQDLSALALADAAAKASRRLSIEQTLFGLPPTASPLDRMAARDASQHADALEDEGAAARAMRAAQVKGDTELVSAIAARAVGEGWRNLAAAYVSDIRPDAADTITELMERDTRNATRQFIDGADFYAAPPPGLPADSYRLRAEAAALDAADGIRRAPSTAAAHTPQSRLEHLASQPRQQVARDELEQFAMDMFTTRTAAEPVEDPIPDTAA